MTKPIVTKQMLIDAKACRKQVNLFEKTFGDSVVVTVKRAEKVVHLFQWDWGTRLLDAQGRAEYSCGIEEAQAKLDRVIEPALAELDRFIVAAHAEYKRDQAAALAKLNRVLEAARAEYLRVEAAELDEYRHVLATAWATAFIDMHKREKDAFRASQPTQSDATAKAGNIVQKYMWLELERPTQTDAQLIANERKAGGTINE
jgi:hypothetical protein